MILLLLSCKGEPVDAAWCEDATPAPSTAPLTWYQDIEPIVTQKCVRCHDGSSHAPFALATPAYVAEQADAVRAAVLDRSMPPWLADECCTTWYDDFGLTDDEIAAIAGWIDAGMPEGDPESPAEPRTPVGELSRVDLTLTMAETYTPQPPAGENDDTRCFVLEWPETETTYITGLTPRPLARDIVHHLVVGKVAETDADALRARDDAEDGPGFDCGDGFGDVPTITPIGGSLLGGDYPRGIGTEVEPGGVLVLQIHYSVGAGVTATPDLTSLDFRLDADATPAGALIVANAGWLVGDGMLIEAGDPDATFYYKYNPRLFTGGKAVDLEGVTPHMHRYASKMRVLALHADGSSDCLLQIDEWEFGWEMPYWFAEPIRLEPEDEIYVECHFDNSAANQPEGQEPRDIAWGDNDQDMCVAFVDFTAID